MDQMADEIALRADVKDKERINSAEESSAWVTGDVSSERMQTDTQTKTETSKDSATQRSRECSLSSSPLFSLKMYLRRSSSTDSSIGASLSSSQQTSTVDCAGMVLSCLFCRFYDLMFMLPDSCGRFANHCCPNRKQVAPTAESTPSTDEDLWTEMDCGLFTSCHDANDCLELAMEVSELCYH